MCFELTTGLDRIDKSYLSLHTRWYNETNAYVFIIKSILIEKYAIKDFDLVLLCLGNIMISSNRKHHDLKQIDHSSISLLEKSDGSSILQNSGRLTTPQVELILKFGA